MPRWVTESTVQVGQQPHEVVLEFPVGAPAGGRVDRVDREVRRAVATEYGQFPDLIDQGRLPIIHNQ